MGCRLSTPRGRHFHYCVPEATKRPRLSYSLPGAAVDVPAKHKATVAVIDKSGIATLNPGNLEVTVGVLRLYGIAAHDVPIQKAAVRAVARRGIAVLDGPGN